MLNISMLFTSAIVLFSAACVKTDAYDTAKPEAYPTFFCEVNCPGPPPTKLGEKPLFDIAHFSIKKQEAVGTQRNHPQVSLYATARWDDGGGEFRFIILKSDPCPKIESIRIAGGASLIYARRICIIHQGEKTIDLATISYSLISDITWPIGDGSTKRQPYLKMNLNYQVTTEDEQQVSCEIHELMSIAASIVCTKTRSASKDLLTP